MTSFDGESSTRSVCSPFLLMSASGDSRPRTPVSSRLDALFSSSSSTRSSLDSIADADAMRRPPASAVAARRPTSSHKRGGQSLPHALSSSNLAMSETDDVKRAAPFPILRWLASGTASRSSSRPPSPPSAANSSLAEALREDLPSLPPAAHLPSSFYPSRVLARHPPFLDNLTRTTLPTASVTSPDSAHSTTSHGSPEHAPLFDPTPSSPVFLGADGSGRRRTSIDTLRSLHDRTLHTSATQQVQGSPPSQWNWFQWTHKENSDKLLSEDDRAETDEQEQEHINRKYRTPSHPLVFCHGLLGFDSVSIGPSIAPVEVTHWRGIKEILESIGCEVLITRVPATSSPQDRAKVLEQRISEVYPGRAVHLIGHSMGGVDCRYLTTHLTHRKFDVLSVTTIAAPHRGSCFADHFLELVGTSRMPSVLGLLDMLPNGGGDGRAFESLTVENMRKFNEETPNVDGVKYFSWGATYDPGLIDTWKYSHGVVLEKEGPNDGLVSVWSSKWGTYLGTLENVNHLDLVGWTNVARYTWASVMGREIKFKPATFYLGIADHLAKSVEGQEDEEDEDSHPSQPGGPQRRTSDEERAAMSESLQGSSQAQERKGQPAAHGKAAKRPARDGVKVEDGKQYPEASAASADGPSRKDGTS